MGREIDRLTVRGCATKPPGFHADGGGLYLRVDPTGARRWVFVFFIAGRRREMGLGPLSDISLARARELAQEARAQVRTGQSPIEIRRRQRAAVVTIPFGDLADQLLADLSPEWKNPVHRRQWATTLKVDAKALRPRLVADITTEDVLGVLKPIWQVKPETARRLRGRIERVLDAAKARGMRAGDNPARWKGHMALLLPKRPKAAKRHHAAVPYAKVGDVFRDLGKRDSISALALEFTILTVARTSETLNAMPHEIDVAARVWTVPGARMKASRDHRVPLSPRALVIARDRIAADPTGPLFPNASRKPLSNMAMTQVLKKAGWGAFTVHGFRSTFRDWAGDRTTFAREIIEAAMAHIVGDEAEQAYRRGDALDRRRQLMDAWAIYCAAPTGAKVIKIA